MMLNRIAQTTYLQLLWVGILMVFSTLLLSGLAYLISVGLWGEEATTLALSGFSEDAAEVAALRLFQLVSHLAIFIIPALSLYFMVRKSNPNFLMLNQKITLNPLLMVALLYVVFLPLVQYTLVLNQQITFPESLRSWEQWITEKENVATQLTEAFLKVSDWNSFLANFFIMAIIPAVGEELLFRGLLTHWFSKIIRNPHLNIILVSLLFSAIHMQFFGFIPRFLLGMLLGYLAWWTQNLWYPILLHLLNNGITVIVYFWIARSGSDVNPEEVGTPNEMSYVLLSIAATAFILYWFWKQRQEAEG